MCVCVCVCVCVWWVDGWVGEEWGVLGYWDSEGGVVHEEARQGRRSMLRATTVTRGDVVKVRMVMVVVVLK